MTDKPLAYRMRPKDLKDVLGQEKIKSFLQSLIDQDSLISMVFYGPPGTGKTTLAEAFSHTFNAYCVKLNAVIDNKARMEEAFGEAIRFHPAIVIIDEIHRLDKGKQDLLLPHLENGDFFLIGCTTANPLISLNPAIRSRTRLLETMPLTKEEIRTGLNRAVNSPDGLSGKRTFAPEALDYISSISAGDLRFAYNQLEAVALSYTSSHTITKEDAKSVSPMPNYLSDLDGDEHYDTVSALQKSIRGSEVDAALFYLAKLLKSGDLEGLCRRLVITAYEDVGLANPAAVDRTVNACNTALSVGLPEAEIPLGFSVVDLALSPKSKSSCLAIEEAMRDVEDGPVHVRSYLRLKQAGEKPGESYDYDDSGSWPFLEYLPEGKEDLSFYHPMPTSKYERALEQNYELLKKNRRAASVSEAKKRSREKKQ